MCYFSWQVQHLVTFMFHFLWQVQHVVTFMFHFLWQVQHLVKFMCHFSWQAQHVVKFMCHFSWQVQHWVKFMCHFSWQAQHLEKFMCHFSWQAQHVVKFGMIAGAGNVVIFNGICSWRVRKVASVARRVAVCVFWAGSWSDRSRIMLGYSRIGRALEMALQLFSVNFFKIWKCNFAWQAQCLVRLQGDACRSAHCKWRFICDADQSWHSFCVAGAVFGEVGGRFLSLRAL